MSRQGYNKKILEEITILVEEHPDLRFHQILQIVGVVELDEEIPYGEMPHEFTPVSSDKFHEESNITYKRICDKKTKDES